MIFGFEFRTICSIPVHSSCIPQILQQTIFLSPFIRRVCPKPPLPRLPDSIALVPLSAASPASAIQTRPLSPSKIAITEPEAAAEDYSVRTIATWANAQASVPPSTPCCWNKWSTLSLSKLAQQAASAQNSKLEAIAKILGPERSSYSSSTASDLSPLPCRIPRKALGPGVGETP